MKLYLTTIFSLFLFCVVPSAAQQNTLSGRVVDGETNDALQRATLQLYRLGAKDTTFVTGTYSDAGGRFSFNNVSTGNYLLKATFLGYKDLKHNVTKRSGAQNLGTLRMEENAVQLEGATVTANVPKMVIKDDTVVYNADAFRVPEG